MVWASLVSTNVKLIISGNLSGVEITITVNLFDFSKNIWAVTLRLFELNKWIHNTQ